MTHSSSARSPRAIVGALLLAAMLAACGAPNDSASSQPAQSPGASGFPVDVVSGATGSTDTITVDQRPEAIVSLSPTATESLFAIDAGAQVVAVDEQSNYPAEAPVTQLSGYTPNVEAILNYSPDLVITAMPDPDTVASLAAAGVPTLALPPASTLDEAYDQLARLGQATGNTDQAAALVADMKSRIEQAVSAAPDLSGVSYFHELDPTLYTVSSSSFIGEIYGLFGMKSIADAAPGGDAFPQLSEEFVVDANPDVILLADAQCCGVTPGSVAQRPGWAEVRAVQQNQVFVLNADIVSRWGPRVVDFVESISSYASQLNLEHA